LNPNKVTTCGWKETDLTKSALKLIITKNKERKRKEKKRKEKNKAKQNKTKQNKKVEDERKSFTT